MDSLQLMLSCFLLLIALPHSNIAMPKASHAERTRDSSTGETDVTAYLCRGPESSVCNEPAYEGCEKIYDTQNNTFSNKMFHWKLKETSISLCYQSSVRILEEIVIGIVWNHAKGIGNSCGTVNSAENETCCEVEINFENPSGHLKCYFKTADDKGRRSSADVTDKRNLETPQPIIDEQSSSSAVIVMPALIVIVCGTALGLYCAQRRRNSRDIFLFNCAAVGKKPQRLQTYLTPI